MKKIILVIVLFFVFLKPSFAQENPQPQAPKQKFFQAKVVEVVEQKELSANGIKNYLQVLRIKILDGKEKGKFTIIQNGNDMQITKDQLVSKNQNIVISKTTYLNNKVVYSIYDFYRLNSLIIFVILFFLLVVFIAGLKGIGSILGMIISFGVIIGYIIPSILHGQDPLTVTVIGSVFILFVTTYLAHGISQKTTIALMSTLISLFIAVGFAIAAIKYNNITGLGNEDIFALQMGATNIINFKGLFLSGVIISTLGALNDITTTQSATIWELKKTNPKLKFVNLFEGGINVGREHIASLVNTLILAYVGSALAIFIFLVLNPNKLPYWVILNNEIISDEIIRIITGSAGLLLSVPIVTFIASYFFSGKKISG